MNEFIDVLLPTIRIDEWLDQTVASVLAQDVNDFHLYVILDGVPPEPRRCWMDDPRVSLVAIPTRKGLPHALNVGLARSGGSLVARVDADDPCLPGRFRSQREFLVGNPDIAVVASAATVIDQNDKVIGRVGPATIQKDFAPTLLVRNRILHSSVMFRREAIEAVGGYDESMPYMEDYELWFRLAMRYKIGALPEELIRYRVHSGQMTKAAPPWGIHMSLIAARRVEYGLAIGSSALRTWSRSIPWCVMQYFRYFRWKASARYRGV